MEGLISTLKNRIFARSPPREEADDFHIGDIDDLDTIAERHAADDDFAVVREFDAVEDIPEDYEIVVSEIGSLDDIERRHGEERVNKVEERRRKAVIEDEEPAPRPIESVADVQKRLGARAEQEDFGFVREQVEALAGKEPMTEERAAVEDVDDIVERLESMQKRVDEWKMPYLDEKAIAKMESERRQMKDKLRTEWIQKKKRELGWGEEKVKAEEKRQEPGEWITGGDEETSTISKIKVRRIKLDDVYR